MELTSADPEDPCLPNVFISDPPLNQIVAGTWEAGIRDITGAWRWAVAGLPRLAMTSSSSAAVRGAASPFHPEAEEAEITVAAGDRLPSVPTHTAQGSLTADLSSRLKINIGLRGQSGQFMRGEEANLVAPLPGFATANIQAHLDLTKKISATLDAQNIFDAQFYTFGTFGDASGLDSSWRSRRYFSPGAPRAFWLGLHLRL